MTRQLVMKNKREETHIDQKIILPRVSEVSKLEGVYIISEKEDANLCPITNNYDLVKLSNILQKL